MKLRTRMLRGFLLMAVVAVVLGVIGLVSTLTLDNLTTQMHRLTQEQDSISSVLNAHYAWRQGITESVLTGGAFTGSVNPDTCLLGTWFRSEFAQRINDPELIQLMTDIDAPHRLIHLEAQNVVSLTRENKLEDAKNLLKNVIFPITDEVIALLSDMQTRYVDLVEAMDGESVRIADTMKILNVVFIAGAVAFCLFLAFAISGSICKPINQLVDIAKHVAEGDLNVHIDTSRTDETGVLARRFAEMVAVIQKLAQDINHMGRRVNTEGDIDAALDVSQFKGAYREVAESMNHAVRSIIDDILMFFTCLTQFINGDFNADIPKLPGKKQVMNQSLDAMRHNLKAVSGSIGALVENAINGNLSARVDVSVYKGDWASLMDGMNHLLEAVIAPIHEASGVLGHVSAGCFDQKMEGRYQGDFLVIKESINTTVTNIAVYINEISSVLNALAADDLNQDIQRAYVGRFSDIKNALLNIIEKFNRVIANIAMASAQVSSGAKLISENSMRLAAGATAQAASVEELNATIQTIDENTRQNAESAAKADILADGLVKNAQRGNDDMAQMMTAMDSIKESSNRISKIIKVIEDIAFQTNLLALNAAVEAARAGEHGKGFSVVAEEVRNLAGKTSGSAKETALLIEEAISRVNDGTQTANKTGEAFQTIVREAARVADLITDIAKASGEQSQAIGQIMTGITQITDVVQQNSASAEESASASQELASQSDVLKSMIDVFKLRNNTALHSMV